jgi:hypothetical protein
MQDRTREEGRRSVDPFLDYYLCTKDGETQLVESFCWEADALAGYDSVQKLAYWQALQWNGALWEVERSPAQVPDLFPLAAFMGASEERIREFFEGE